MTKQEAISLLQFWWMCVESGRELDGDDRIPDDAPILHFCANGATAIVTAGHFRALCAPDDEVESFF